MLFEIEKKFADGNFVTNQDYATLEGLLKLPVNGQQLLKLARYYASCYPSCKGVLTVSIGTNKAAVKLIF